MVRFVVTEENNSTVVEYLLWLVLLQQVLLCVSPLFILLAHFALVKFQLRNDLVPHDDPNRGWKIVAPTVAFATKHVIQLQLGVLPLTMCRYTINKLSSTSPLNRLIPFEEFTKYHIAIGYTLVSLVLVAFVVFMTYYGTMCARGEQEFCDGFASEMMLTGYAIFILFMVVGASSYYRFDIKYQVFYNIHQIVFLGFFVSIMHTIDNLHRSNGGRSQAYKWFSASLLLYITDRIAMYTTARYTIKVCGYQVINETQDTTDGIIVLKMRKPTMLHFDPGHYCRLRIMGLDRTWHPFSIASSPDSDILEFYIKINQKGSWTWKLLQLLLTRVGHEDDLVPIEVEIMGPYGSPLATAGDHSHALVVGSGTGKTSWRAYRS